MPGPSSRLALRGRSGRLGGVRLTMTIGDRSERHLLGDVDRVAVELVRLVRRVVFAAVAGPRAKAEYARRHGNGIAYGLVRHRDDLAGVVGLLDGAQRDLGLTKDGNDPDHAPLVRASLQLDARD